MFNKQFAQGLTINGLVRIIIVLCLIATGQRGLAQHTRDTVAVIKDLDAVMAFAIQPYVYYSTTTSLLTGPMIGGRDSVADLHGKFYKCGDDLYYGTEAAELFIQDSLMITIDHRRKAIEIRRVDMSTKKNIDVLPLKKLDRQRMLRDGYVLAEVVKGGDTSIITIRSQPTTLFRRLRSTEMRVEYVRDSHLPLFMEVTMHVPQDGSEQTRALLKTKGFNVGRMAENVNGVPYLIMNETAAVRFNEVSMTEEQALQMPLWTERLLYDKATDQFHGTGPCEGYAVTKTF